MSRGQHTGQLFRSRKWLILGLAFLGLLALLLSAAFFFPQQVLCVDNHAVRADAMVVLGGGTRERPERAAELYRLGAASRIIVSGRGDFIENQRILEAAGVPASAILVEPKSNSTKENAQFSIPLLRAMNTRDREATPHSTVSPDGAGRESGGRGVVGASRVIIVTSWYHSRRALHTFRHYAPDIQFYSRPSYFAYPRSEWAAQGVRKYICAEYVKLAGYWACYGVWPF